MKDIVSAILAFFFAKDRQEHPMPPEKTEKVFWIIQDLTERNEEKDHD